jgi:gluconokinase
MPWQYLSGEGHESGPGLEAASRVSNWIFSAGSQRAQNQRNVMIVIVAGVSGSGKTTVGAMLAGRLGWRFADADDFHPAANVEKMRAGIPLTDADRWPWLQALAAWMDERIAQGKSAVITCSALKRAYRDLLLGGRPQAQMIFLAVDREVLARRLAARHGHFFPGQLLGTQMDALEPPGPDERVISIVPADEPADTVASIVAVLWPGEDGGPGASGAAGGDHEAEA